jgi:ketosteroid isomerase-like protein
MKTTDWTNHTSASRVGISRGSIARRLTTGLMASATLLLLPVITPQAQHPTVTMQTLLDRIQIEELLVRYYDDLSRGARHALSDYFTEDAVLDVDGTVATGHAEIGALYQRPDADEASEFPEMGPVRRMNMLLSNPIIEVDGDTATAHVIWTGIMNEGIGTSPHVYEQGREFSELRKVDGRWLISRRYVSSDGRPPNRFDETYYPREHRPSDDE